jgi:hypothetical protein
LLPAKSHLPPAHHETSKHSSPNKTKIKVVEQKCPRFKFKQLHVNDSSQIKTRNWPLGFSAAAWAASKVLATSRARAISAGNAGKSELLQDKSCGNKTQEKWEIMKEVIGIRAEFCLHSHTNPNRAKDIPVDRGQHLM